MPADTAQGLDQRQLIRSGTFEETPPGPAADRISTDSEEAREAEDAPQQTARLVRQIPDEQWNAVKDDILLYLQDEFTDARAERSEFERKIARWKEEYRAPPAVEPKHFPIWNASNITVPIIKEGVNTLAAQIAQSVLVARPRWVLKDMAEEWRPFTDLVEDFLDLASDRDMEISQRAVPWIIECVKLGTSVMDVGWAFDKKGIYKYSADGKKTFKSDIVMRDGPLPVHFPIQDFWIRFDQTDPDEARWASRRLWLTEYELRRKSEAGELFRLEKISGQTRMTRDMATRVEQEIEGTRPNNSDLWEIFKVFISWDIDGDGEDEELLLHYSHDAREVLSARYFPFWHGRRPIITARYFPVEHRFYAMGVCEMLEEIQQAFSDDWNKRADNQTLANASMIIKRKMTKGLMPGDPLYAAKIIETADIWNDIREFRISEPYPSTVTEMQMLRKMGDDLIALSDAQRGSALPVSRTTAAAQLSLLQEQATRIGLTVQNIRGSLDELGRQSSALYYQFGTNGKALEWLGERGRAVEALFRLPRRVAEIGAALVTETPTSAVNKQVKRENSVALFNLIVQMYQQLIPLVGEVSPDAAAPVVGALVVGAKRFMEDTLNTFDVTDPDEVLAGLTVLEHILPNPTDLGGGEETARLEEQEDLTRRLNSIEAIYEEAKAIREQGRDPTRRRTTSPRNGREATQAAIPAIPLGDGGRPGAPPFIGPTASPPFGPGRGV